MKNLNFIKGEGEDLNVDELRQLYEIDGLCQTFVQSGNRIGEIRTDRNKYLGVLEKGVSEETIKSINIQKKKDFAKIFGFNEAEVCCGMSEFNSNTKIFIGDVLGSNLPDHLKIIVENISLATTLQREAFKQTRILLIGNIVTDKFRYFSGRD